MGLYIGYNIVSPMGYNNDSSESKKIINGTINSIVIPSDISNIREYAFYSCSDLTSVTIPENVNTIGVNAFGNCANLTTINIDKYPNTIPGSPWGAYNASINWKPTPPQTIDLTGYQFSLNNTEVIVNEYTGSDINVILPNVEEE